MTSCCSETPAVTNNESGWSGRWPWLAEWWAVWQAIKFVWELRRNWAQNCCRMGNFHWKTHQKKTETERQEASDSKMTASAAIDRVMKCTVDTFVSEIETRSKWLNGLNAKFGLLMDVAAVIDIDDLQSCWSTALTLQQHIKMTSTAVAMLSAGNYWLPYVVSLPTQLGLW